jgi:uncharacterized membrane protein
MLEFTPLSAQNSAMSTTYDRIAGQSVERLAALSDGLFGVAMTLLLLEVQPPAHPKTFSEADLIHALANLAPDLLIYLMSFLTLGIFWIGQQTQLNHLERSERTLTWLHLFFLFAVTIVPFSTRLLEEFINYRTALLAYWANIFVLGLLLYFCWGRAVRAKLLKADLSVGVQAAICRRIMIAQGLYAVGALMCFVHPYVSIAFIVLVQLNYVLAPAEWFAKTTDADAVEE